MIDTLLYDALTFYILHFTIYNPKSRLVETY